MIAATLITSIKRPLLNLQGASGNLLDAQEHAVAMELPQRDGFQDEEIESAGQQFRRRVHDALTYTERHVP
jgi:hypothetical protein